MVRMVTSVTVFQDAVGLRMSVTYSEIDEEQGAVVSDNKRIDKILLNPTTKKHSQTVIEDAQAFVDSAEG